MRCVEISGFEIISRLSRNFFFPIFDETLNERNSVHNDSLEKRNNARETSSRIKKSSEEYFRGIATTRTT